MKKLLTATLVVLLSFSAVFSMYAATQAGAQVESSSNGPSQTSSNAQVQTPSNPPSGETPDEPVHTPPEADKEDDVVPTPPTDEDDVVPTPPADEDTDNGSGSAGSSGSGSSGNSAASKTEEAKPVITTDEKKGQVSAETGIITGTGEEYSEWIPVVTEEGAVTWQFEYADGTTAAGTIETREDGTTYEQPAWEMINGAWYAFGADGFAKSAWVADEKLGGWFFIDINLGMITGWHQVNGVWYYLNPVSDGKKGICLTNTWIDGWYVDATGAWDGNAQAMAQ